MQWMQYRLSHKMPGLLLPEVDEILKGTAMLETNMDRWEAQAIAKGMLLGKLEGKLEGESTLLERLLVKRFGPLSEEKRARLRGATADQLEHWAERILEASSLADLFGDH